jgi:hypothetical protein
LRVVETDNVGEGGERREVALATCERIYEEDGRGFLEDHKPAV